MSLDSTLAPLSVDEVEKVNWATVRVLEDTGVRVLSKEAAEILVAAGAQHNPETTVAKIPERVRKELLSKVPRIQ